MPSAKELRKTLSLQLREGLISHAVLIEGESGAGKRELALWLAKAVLCSGEIKPCEVCSSCRKANAGSHPDIRILEDTKNKQSFGIEPIRAMKEELYILPNESDQKVYLLFGAEKMTAEAQNAFLKSLEEPPSHARFILTCENRKSLLDTIISRVTCYNLDLPAKEECAFLIAEEFPDIPKDEAELLSIAYGGNFGAVKAALSEEKRELVALAAKTPKLLKEGKTYTLSKEITQICKTRAELSEYFERLLNIAGRCGIDAACKRASAVRVSPIQAVKTSEIIERRKESLSQNCSLDLVISLFCAELSGVYGGNI